jgi:ectoine hydroxylase-related dioxygenase (phytanoyl-CoA dioxygenase family)
MAYGTKTGDSAAKPAVATTRSWRDSLTIPPLESPFFEAMLAGSGLSAEMQSMVRKLADDGYVVFRPDIPDFDRVAERVKRDLAGKSDVHRRVSEGWYWNKDVRDLACAPHILQLLKLLYQREAFPFQTLNFEVGSEQPAHSDTIHFHSLPRHYMCGVWLALEDIHPDSGPLVVYPGSHKLPDYDMQDLGVTPHPDHYQQYEEFVREMLRARGFQPLPLCPKKGEAVIWVANLYHGGSGIRDPQRTRYSQATHYYFTNCQYFFPMQSDLPGGKIIRREVIDLRNGRWVQHYHNGQAVELGDLRNVCTYPRPLPSFVK